MYPARQFVLGLALFGLASSSASGAAPQTRGNARNETGQAMRLIHDECSSCHNSEKNKGGLDLTDLAGLKKGGDNGPVINSRKPGKSLLLSVLSPEADPHMPPKKQLSPAQIKTLQKWVTAGHPWDERLFAKAGQPRPVEPKALPPNYQPVLALSVSPDGERLAIGRGGTVFIHDLSSTNFPVLSRIPAHRDAVRSLAWSPDSRTLASGSFREIVLWKGADFARFWSSTQSIDRVMALAFTPDGSQLLAGEGANSQSGWIRVLDPSSGKETSSWKGHDDLIFALVVSPDGKLLATASADKLVKIWSLNNSREINRIEAHLGSAYGLAFNTNATEVVTVGGDQQLRIWDLQSKESVVTVTGKKHGFQSVVWSRDGKTVVASDDSGRLVSFTDFKRHTGAQSSETAREKQLGRWNEPLPAVAISPDGQRVFAGSQDGSVYLVDLEGKQLAHWTADMLDPPAPSASSTSGKKASTPALSFVNDILPVMAKAGCMAGSCHAKAEGQNGFKLSVFSYDPRGDYAEIVKEGRGRRVFPAAPEESLLLLKPSMAIEHGGGLRLEKGSKPYQLLARWIREGMIFQSTNEPTLVRIEVFPAQKIYRKQSTQALKVTAHYSNGSKRDVTSLADFSAPDREMAQVDEQGKVRVGKLSGEGMVIARYMGLVDASRITVPADKTLPSARYASLPVQNFVDQHAYAHFKRLGFYPSDLASDSEFLRRSSLDTIGRLPTPEQAREFLAGTDPQKRERWIDTLLNDPFFGDYWANKWSDLIRPNSDRVGIKSVYLLDQWLRDSFRTNKPYDQFVREILLAEGSNHRDGPAVIYRDRREPPELTTMFSQLFLGTRMECAKCHHHPTEKWSQNDFYQFAAFFGSMKQKGAGLSPPISAGTETFYFAPGGEVKHPVTEEAMSPRPLDGSALSKTGKEDPRRALVEWLTRADNPFFARAAVNRVWAVFFGKGFVEPVDDFRSSNPVVNEPLLNALAEDFAAQGYDFKKLIRTILSSRLYQLSSLPGEHNLKDTRNFSRSLRRRLPAEVMLDAVNDITGVQEDYNGSPPGARAVQTWSYKVSSQFMDAFGRPNPSSDCPCERDTKPSMVQSLHLMNSRGLQAKLSHPEGRVRKLAESDRVPTEIATELYLAAFSRFPTADELALAAAVYEKEKITRQTATEDLLWALLNSAEFVFNH